MKANYHNKYTMSSAERKAMRQEITRQLIEMDREHSNDIDAMILYTLHEEFDFGEKRLRRFYDALLTQRDRLTQHYEMPDEFPWLCKQELKKIGVDIEKWNADKLI